MKKQITIHHKVVDLHAVRGHNLLKAWRLSRGITLEDAVYD